MLGKKTKTGCLSLILNLLNRNLSKKYLLCLREHGEQSEDKSFVWNLQRLIRTGGYKSMESQNLLLL